MAFSAFLTINQNSTSKGASNSDSIGQAASTSSDNYDKITVIGYTSDALIPTLAGAGVQTSGRIYQPVVFKKYFDASSPLLWQALAKNTIFDTLVMDFYRPGPAGSSAPQLYFEITWSTVTFVEGKGYTPLTIDPANAFYQYLEDWSFTFKKVQWDHKISGTTGSDAW